MADKTEQWQIDGYLAVHLMSCFSWRLGRINGYDDQKLNTFHSYIPKSLFPQINNDIIRLMSELYSDVNRSIHSDLPLFCKMIPEAYRGEAWEHCRTILRSVTCKSDEIIYKALERGLK